MEESTEAKAIPIPIAIDEETRYSVQEDDEDEENDQFSRIKPKILKTPSILNAIIDQIHPDIIAK